MKKIIYYVASSIDGYISGVDEDVSGFVGTGNGVAKYLEDLHEYSTVIMGRKTYEFGYKFGLVPGQPAYAHMNHFIFSETLNFASPHEKIKIQSLNLNAIQSIREASPTDIYLCGGGQLAAWLLDHEQIDLLKIKLNPLILGQGVSLFGNSTKAYALELIETKLYDEGLQMMTYRIKYK